MKDTILTGGYIEINGWFYPEDLDWYEIDLVSRNLRTAIRSFDETVPLGAEEVEMLNNFEDVVAKILEACEYRSPKNG